MPIGEIVIFAASLAARARDRYKSGRDARGRGSFAMGEIYRRNSTRLSRGGVEIFLISAHGSYGGGGVYVFRVFLASIQLAVLFTWLKDLLLVGRSLGSGSSGCL